MAICSDTLEAEQCYYRLVPKSDPNMLSGNTLINVHVLFK